METKEKNICPQRMNAQTVMYENTLAVVRLCVFIFIVCSMLIYACVCNACVCGRVWNEVGCAHMPMHFCLYAFFLYALCCGSAVPTLAYE